jgi:hypothetical protein
MVGGFNQQAPQQVPQQRANSIPRSPHVAQTKTTEPAAIAHLQTNMSGNFSDNDPGA